jgi:hypothetical protein
VFSSCMWACRLGGGIGMGFGDVGRVVVGNGVEESGLWERVCWLGF